MKKRPVSNDDFFEGFFQWLDSEKGQTSMEAMEAVAAALKGAHVDTRKRRIVWPDGKRLTIDQSAQRIQKQSGEDLKAIKSHVVGWLEMDFEPKGPNEKQMEIFEAQIEDWIKDYQAGKPDRSRHTRAENSVLSSQQVKRSKSNKGGNHEIQPIP